MTYYQYFQRRAKPSPKKKRSIPLFKREREINPDTMRPFRDPRSKIVHGRVICRGADMEYLRERVGRREGEICQMPNCQAFAPIYPPEGTPAGELHHIYGRGMGGGKRDDRAELCEWLCGGCHKKRKIEPGYGRIDTEAA